MIRVQACFKGHSPHILTTPSTGKKIIICPRCDVSTTQYELLEHAIMEWNYAGGQIWNAYAQSNTFWQRILRWWRGRFV